jgi:5-hydroxyisourate hydrolase-like protein (transthyretin family)
MKKLIFALLLLFFGCYNQNEDELKIRQVSGQVVSKETFLPIEGMKMYLVFNKDNHKDPVDSLVTDKDGRYDFTFLSYGTWDHLIFIKTQPMYDYFINDGYYPVVNLSKTIYLYPKSFLKVKIKNTNPFNEKDKIIVAKLNSPELNIELLGSKVEETKILSDIFENSYKNVLRYYVFKNDTVKTFSIPIKLTSFDTTTVSINY